MVSFKENIFVWEIGAVLYGFIEILWRGYTHWSMVITGGLCLLVIYKVAALNLSVILKAFICMLSVTIIELFVGIIINVIFELDVWDYSDLPFNFMGQICLRYSLFWLLLSIPAIFLCQKIRKSFYPAGGKVVISQEPSGNNF